MQMREENYLQNQLESELQKLQKINIELASLLREKEKQIRKIHHQVKNNLQILASFLRLQSLKINDTTAIKYLNDTILRLNFFTLMQTHFYENNQDRINQRNLENYIVDLQTRIINTYKIDSANIKLNIQLTAVEIPVEQAMTLGFILSEILKLLLEPKQDNSQNHEIVITSQLTDVNFLHLTIFDNIFQQLSSIAQMMDDSFEMEIIQSLVKYQLCGTIELNHENKRFLAIHFKVEH